MTRSWSDFGGTFTHRDLPAVTVVSYTRSCILFAMFIALRGRGHQGEVRVMDHFEVRVDTANPGEDLMGMFWWLRENTRWQKRYVSHYYPPGSLRALTFIFDHEQDAAAFAARFGE